MLKPVMTAAAVLAIAGSSFVYAQQSSGDQGAAGGPRAEQRRLFSPEDRAAFTDARVAALKAGLELTPDQAKNWPAFEQALRDLAQLRAERMQARLAARQAEQQAQSQPQTPPASPFDRLARRADALGKMSAALKKVADTGAPLYASLNDAQKNRFRFLARLLRPHPMMGRTEGQGWREGRGFGRGQFGPGQFGPGQFGPRGGEWRGQRFGEGGPGWGGRPPGDDRGPGFYGRMRRMMQGDDQDSRL